MAKQSRPKQQYMNLQDLEDNVELTEKSVIDKEQISYVLTDNTEYGLKAACDWYQQYADANSGVKIKHVTFFIVCCEYRNIMYGDASVIYESKDGTTMNEIFFYEFSASEREFCKKLVEKDLGCSLEDYFYN